MSILLSQQLPLDAWTLILAFSCNREEWLVSTVATYRKMQENSLVSRTFLVLIRAHMRLSSSLFLHLPEQQKNLMALNVHSLNINNGHIPFPPLEKMTNLKTLVLNLPLSYRGYGLSALVNLTDLTISIPKTSINNEDLLHLTKLINLRLSDPYNLIRDASMSHLTNLEVLEISYNTKITCKTLYQFKKLTSFQSVYPCAQSDLSELVCYLRDYNGENKFPNLTSLSVNSIYTRIGTVNVLWKLSSQLTQLVLSGYDISSRLIKELTALESLQLNEVLFDDVNTFMPLTRLNTLSLYNCRGFNDDVLGKAVSLKTLILHYIGDDCIITDNSISLLTNLTRLELYARKPILTLKSLSSLSELVFFIGDSCITNEILIGLTNMRKLRMETFNGYVNPGLIETVCGSMCQLISLSISYTCKPYSYNNNDNNVNILYDEIGKLTNLTHLKLDDTGLLSVRSQDIYPLMKLKRIEIGDDRDCALTYSEFMEQ